MDTTGSPAEKYIASMAGVHEGLCGMFSRAGITISTPATPSTQSTTRSFRRDLRDAMEHPFTSPLLRAFNAPTSSSEQRLDESLSSDDSFITAALDSLDRTLQAKNKDYRIEGEFSNFEFAAEVAEVEVVEVMLTQIAIKLGRLKGLPDDPHNESRLDTIKDLAGYAVILYAYATWDVSNG